MEMLIVLVVVALPLAAFAGSILGFLAWRRTKKIAAEIHSLQQGHGLEGHSALLQRIRELEIRLRKLEPKEKVTDLSEELPVEAPAPEVTVEPVPPEPFPGIPAPDLDEPQTELPEESIPAPEPRPKTTGQSPPPKEPKTTIPKIEWERWIGVRGAAMAGGIVLALAALLFFQYSIEHGLISPTMRVVFGMAAGIACLLGSEFLHRNKQEAAANALAGAGIVALYAATWAAHVLYSLIGAVPATALMIMITAGCVSLAVARRSQFVAVLGLLGGFSTPVLVAADPAGPVALFGYILLLDLGLLWLARARGWPLLAVLSLVATAIHQGLWIFASMDEERAILGLAVLAVFGLAFLFANGRDAQTGTLWKATRAGGVAIPFAFALHFAAEAKLSANPLPLGALLLVLSIGACWLARRGFKGGDLAAAAASLGVLCLWAISHSFTQTTAWQLSVVCVALAAVFTGFAWWLREASSTTSTWFSALVANVGLMSLISLCCGAGRVVEPWPWLLVWMATSAGVHLLAMTPGKTWTQLAAGIVPSIGLVIFTIAHGRSSEGLSVEGIALTLAGWALASQVVSLFAPEGAYRRWSGRSAACAALLLMPAVAALVAHHRPDGLLGLILVGFLAVVSALAATRIRSGGWYLATVIAAAFWNTVVFEEAFTQVAAGSGLPWPLTVVAATVVLLTAWPAVVIDAFRHSRTAWWAAALAGPLSFIVLRESFIAHFGADAIGLLPIALAVTTLATVMRAMPLLQDTPETLRSAQVWLLAVTLCLVSVAIPMQLEKEWITIGWALNGLAVLALWKRLDHPGLKYLGLTLLGAVTIRLVANPEVLGYHLRGSTPVLNWITYTYLVPAAAMIMSMMILKPSEVERLTPREARLYPHQHPLAAAGCGLAAIATIFVWINLAIADLFSAGPALELSFQRLPARDVTTSVAWALYALVLLVIGVQKHSKSLRWLSLGLLVATLAKVFLHDLGELEDLYRVASLVGLAISLIVVSLIYQRFVFSEQPEDE